MSYADAIIAIGLGIWFVTIAGSIVLTARFAYECWRDNRRQDDQPGARERLL